MSGLVPALASLLPWLLLQAPTAPLIFSATLGSVSLAMRPGDVATRQFRLTLGEDQPTTHFVARFEDWWQSEDGRQSFYAEPGTVGRSCAPWTSVNPVESGVGAGDTLTLRFTIAVPPETPTGGYWCALTVDQVPDPSAVRAGAAVRFTASVSTGVFIEVGPVTRSASIADVRVEADQAIVAVRNHGDTHLRVDGYVEFVEPGVAGAPVTVVLPRSTLLTEPVNLREVRVDLPDAETLPTGLYEVRAVVDIGVDHYLGAARQVRIDRGDGAGASAR